MNHLLRVRKIGQALFSQRSFFLKNGFPHCYLKTGLFILLFAFVHETYAQCTARAVYNTNDCNQSSSPGVLTVRIQGALTSFENVDLTFTECGSTATLTGRVRNVYDETLWNLTINFTGRTNSGFGYDHECISPPPSQNDWYYYTALTGTLASVDGTSTIPFQERSSIIQVGTNATYRGDAGQFGLASWLTFGAPINDIGDIFLGLGPVISPSCTIQVSSAIPTPCNSTNNSYSVNGSLSFTNPPTTGSLTINTAEGISQTFYAPFYSPISYSLTGLAADGSVHTITASFSATNCSTTTTYTAPQSCVVVPCSISSVTASPSTCNSATNTYSASGTIYFNNPPNTGTLTVSDGSASQTFYAPFTSPLSYTLTGITANGNTHTVTASFSAANCSKTATYTAPQSCVVVPCSISSVSAAPGACSSATNTYSATGWIDFTHPPSTGTLTVSDGAASQTFYAPFTSPLSYTLTGITANGSTHTVTASFSAANCSKTTTYTAPPSCAINNCSVTITAIPGDCNSTTNMYSISGRATILNAVAGSTITFTDGTVSQSYTVPSSQVSYTWVDYTLTGLTSNGNSHTVTAVVSNGTSCSGSTTYIAPGSCLCTTPTPTVNSPTICAGSSATLTVSNCSGTVTWNDGTTGLTKTVSPTTTTTYTATCNVGTCTGTATGTVTVTPKPTPTVNSPTICAGSSATLTVSNCAGTVSWNDGTTGLTKTVSPTATTSYTATCSIGTCTGTATGTVTVTPKPTPTPSVNSPTICSGSSAVLTVSNCTGTVSWNDGTTGLTKNVNPTATTTYTAICTEGTAPCTGTGTATATVTVTPKPTPSVNSPTVCSGNSATLTVSNCAGTVSWNDGTTGATKTVSPTATTSYTATCSVGSCTGTATGTITVTTASNPTPSVNSPTICAGSSATLTVSNCAGTVSWNDGTTGLTKTVSPTATTSYTATCTVTTGNCSGMGTATGTVTVTPKPTPSVNSPTICTGNSATLTVSNCAGSVSWNDGTTGATKTVSPTATTSYTATCSVGSCTGTATGTITVTTASNPTPSVNSPTICAGSSATLTVSNCAGTVSWNDGTTGLTKTVSPTATTSYTATCTVTTGDCSGTGTTTATVTVTPKPTPSVNSPTVCTGNSATLTVSNCAGTVSWNDGTTGATKTVSPTATTSYTATCSVGTCTGTVTGTVTVTTSANPTPSVNSPTICTGNSATLTVSNCAGTVSWNDGTTGLTKTVSPTATTSYTATCSVSTGSCSGTGTATATVTVTPKPAPTPSVNSPTICSGSSAVLTVSNCTGTVSWNDGTTGLTKTVSPTSITTYTATCTEGTASCIGTGTATATVTVTPKPTPSVNSPTVCTGNSATLTVSNCAGTVSWNDGTTGITKTVSPTATTSYTATCSVGSCTGSATGTITVTPLPVAGAPSVTQATCNAANNDASISISGITNTTVYSYTVDGSLPTFANATPLSNGAIHLTNLANPTSAVTYKFRMFNASADCYTEVSAILNPKNCNNAKGSLGDFVWKDTNNNGIQDEITPNAGGVAGVQVELYKNGVYFAKDTTDATGHYLFTNLDAGTYKIKVLSASIPAGCEISSRKDMPSDDAKDSDVDKTTGFSGDYVINPTNPAQKDILTVDAALTVPCVKSKVTLTGAPICSANLQTYSISFSVTGKNGIIKVNKGTLTGNNPYTVTNIPSEASVKITDSLSAFCKFDTLITGPNCNCNPALPKLLTPSFIVCAGDTFPTLRATVVGLATVEWFMQPTGGTVVFTGLNYKPAGTVPAAGASFYAQARSTDPSCPAAISTGRVMATISAQDCNKVVDLALKKSINTKIAQIGDVLTYTLKVWNESGTNATGVEVTDSIATTVQFQTGSFVASRGTAAITGNVIKWIIGGIAANGDTVTLTYRVKATQEGVHFNTAEICKTNEQDVDSSPCNNKDEEDDIDRQCFTVPFKLCPSEQVQVNVPSTLTNVQWFKNGSKTPIAHGNAVLLAEIGTYTFTASNQSCPTEGCCPIIIEAGTNCCPTELCIPFTIKKRKK